MRAGLVATIVLFLVVSSAVETARTTPQSAAQSNGSKTPEEWLGVNLARFHRKYDVYSDGSAAGNHFSARGRMYCDPRSGVRDADGACGAREEQGARAVPPMDEDHRCPGRPGTCIRATFRGDGRSDTWGGWYFLNGVFPSPSPGGKTVGDDGRGAAPGENWGTIPDAGVDLRGATEISFWAAADRDNVLVDFFAFGVGRNEQGDPLRSVTRPDSSFRAPARDGGVVRLTKQWKRFTISLRGLRLEQLEYVLGGFAWVAASRDNHGDNVTFYVDDISYDLARTREPRFPLSYETAVSPDSFGFDSVTRNTAFTYDAAVAVIAFIAAGDFENAKLIADALVYAQAHDRFFDDGRIRNAYQAGDLFLPPGWAPERDGWSRDRRQRTVRAPGWYVAGDQGQTRKGWYEDEFHAGTHTGNVAWTMLALLSYWEGTSNRLTIADRRAYLTAAVRLAEWLDASDGCGCKDLTTDDRGGYTGGYNGWEGKTTKIRYRSTEHNIDLAAAMDRLSRATGDDRWAEDARHARRFVENMWTDGKYLTGSGEDGTGINKWGVVPVDVQAWAVLALGDRARTEALAYADRELRASTGDGFAFSQVDRSGLWYEGTAQMALAFKLSGNTTRANQLLELLRRARLDSGALNAASKDGLDTGFESVPGKKWLYYKRPHVGATAWAVLAERGFNPFTEVRLQ